MHVLLAPIGSAGDVLPFCALGRRLRARGCSVAVAANAHFAHDVRAAELDFVAAGDAAEYEALVANPDAVDGVRGYRAVMRYVGDGMRALYDAAIDVRPQIIVAHPLALAANAAAEKLACDDVTVYLSPSILQSAHLPPVLPGVPNGARFPSWYKRAVAWSADRLLLDGAIKPALDRLRAEHGLPRIKEAFRHRVDERRSMALFADWFAPRQPDWPRRLVQCGFPAPDDRSPLPPLPDEFLDGRAIAFTPGTGNRHAQRFFAAAIDAAAALGRRAILLTRFAEQLPTNLPPHALHVAWAPMLPLLRRAAALVHHGGIGTLAAALAAGVPQVVTPLGYDQPDNAARLIRLGVGAELSPKKLTGATLAAALSSLLSSPDVALRAREAAERMRGPDGLADRLPDGLIDGLDVAAAAILG